MVVSARKVALVVMSTAEIQPDKYSRAVPNSAFTQSEDPLETGCCVRDNFNRGSAMAVAMTSLFGQQMPRVQQAGCIRLLRTRP